VPAAPILPAIDTGFAQKPAGRKIAAAIESRTALRRACRADAIHTGIDRSCRRRSMAADQRPAMWRWSSSARRRGAIASPLAGGEPRRFFALRGASSRLRFGQTVDFALFGDGSIAAKKANELSGGWNEL
jgi:hypothetical protein